MKTVYATRTGRAFHAGPTCRALLGGQLMNDGFKVFWLARNDYRCLHRIEPISIPEAFGQGKEPCGVCLAPLQSSLYRGNSEDDFGHEPVEIQGDHFCARCRTPYIDDDGEPQSYPTLWPCTSATVLGLVDRKETTA